MEKDYGMMLYFILILRMFEMSGNVSELLGMDIGYVKNSLVIE